MLRIISLLVLALGAAESLTHFVNHSPLAYLVGTQPAADYRAAELGWYEPASQLLPGLPDGARVVFLWEPRSLSCPATVICEPDVAIDRWWHARRTIGTAEAILDRWRSGGATHILVYETGANFVAADPLTPVQPSDWVELAALRRGLEWVAAAGPAYTLYAIP